MIEYVIEKESGDINNQESQSYSIVVKNDGVVSEKVSNAFLNESYAEKIVSLCNHLQLSPIHICEVVENAIYNYYYQAADPVRKSAFRSLILRSPHSDRDLPILLQRRDGGR